MPFWTGPTNPYQLTPQHIQQLRQVNPDAAATYERWIAAGRRPNTPGIDYTAWKHGLQSLTEAGMTNPRTGGRMSFFPEGTRTGYDDPNAPGRYGAGGRYGSATLPAPGSVPRGGPAAGGGAGGGAVPGYLRSYFGFLGREAIKEAERTGTQMAPGMLGRIKTGGEAAEADYLRNLMGQQREGAMAQRGFETARQGAESRSQQIASEFNKGMQDWGGGVQSAYQGAQAQMLGYQTPSGGRMRKPLAAQPRPTITTPSQGGFGGLAPWNQP